jgi:3-hydroxyacyl-[acyl-carrier-protein] dehydratase
MAKALHADLGQYDLSRLQFTRDQIYAILPHRHEVQQLDGIVHIDPVYAEGGLVIAVRDIRDDEWWVRGHIPGRPIFPGVLMIESAAQLAAFATYQGMKLGPDAFVGFGGIDRCKFRKSVEPGHTVYLLCLARELRTRRVKADLQGVVDGELVFEANITGMVF